MTLSLDQNNRTSNGAYVFSSQPRVVQQRNKYREYHTAELVERSTVIGKENNICLNIFSVLFITSPILT